MGQWTIVIHGRGIHHNSLPDDADMILKEFVTRLQGAGHIVEHAAVTAGVTTGATPLQARPVEHSTPVAQEPGNYEILTP